MGTPGYIADLLEVCGRTHDGNMQSLIISTYGQAFKSC
jgi:hypothetical protein